MSPFMSIKYALMPPSLLLLIYRVYLVQTELPLVFEWLEEIIDVHISHTLGWHVASHIPNVETLRPPILKS